MVTIVERPIAFDLGQSRVQSRDRGSAKDSPRVGAIIVVVVIDAFRVGCGPSVTSDLLIFHLVDLSPDDFKLNVDPLVVRVGLGPDGVPTTAMWGCACMLRDEAPPQSYLL